MNEKNTSVELVKRASAGDRIAMEQLMLDHYPRLSRYVAGELSDPIDATLSVDDVVQETLVHAIRDMRKCTFDSERAFFAWLKKIAANRLYDVRRVQRSKKRAGERQQAQAIADAKLSSLIDLVDQLSDRNLTPGGSAARREAIGAIQVAIAALPIDQREAVDLYCLRQLSLEETAAAMKRTPTAIRGLVHRAKTKLRAALRRSSLWLD